MTIERDLFDAAERGDPATVAVLLDRHPDKLQVRTTPYALSLLHLAAAHGRLSTVHLLLQRGLDVNTRDEGDNSYPMHWAAGRGHLEVVRALADAGGDVVGSGDDHAWDVIGWATCFDQCHVAVADFLVSRGARHHVFSAVAMDLPDGVRRIAAADPGAVNRRQSHNEDFRRPLHFAVLKNRPAMVELLLTLGADPLGTDGSGYPAPAYASRPDVDRPILEMIRAQRGVDAHIRDSKHDGDAIGWAEHFGQPDIVRILTGGAATDGTEKQDS